MKYQEKIDQQQQKAVIANLRDCNSIQKTAGNIHPFFNAHWSDMTTGEAGLAALIVRIMEKHGKGKTFPLNVGDTSQRGEAIALGMFTREIEAAVKLAFTQGTDRYCIRSIKTFLGHWMKASGLVGKVELLSEESRRVKRAKVVWFLLDQTTTTTTN